MWIYVSECSLLGESEVKWAALSYCSVKWEKKSLDIFIHSLELKQHEIVFIFQYFLVRYRGFIITDKCPRAPFDRVGEEPKDHLSWEDQVYLLGNSMASAFYVQNHWSSMHFMSRMSTIGQDKVPGVVHKAVQNLERLLIESREFTANIRNTNVLQGFYTWHELEQNSSSSALACLSPHGM